MSVATRSRALAAALVFLSAGGAAPVEGQDIFGRIRGAAGAAVRAHLPIGAAKETEIGRGIAATVAGRWRVVPDSALNAYVDLVGQVVAQQSPRAGEVAFRFAVLDTDEVNAFAAPGGYVFVTRGALAMMRSEAELAGVLAHEVGHVDEKHVLQHIQKADALRGMRDEAGLTGPVLDQVAAMGSSRLFTGLERGDEMQADSLALLYAAAAGYRADGLLRFLTRLGEAEAAEEASSAGASAPARGLGARLREMRATHPPTADRIAAVGRHLSSGAIDPAAGEAVEARFRERVRVAP